MLPDRAPLDLAALAPEFHDPPENMFYKYAQGELSPYGAEAAGLVRSLAKERALVPASYAQDSAAEFKAYTGRLNSINKKFLEQWVRRGAVCAALRAASRIARPNAWLARR